MHRYVPAALALLVSAAIALPAVPPAHADSIGEVVGARAKDRAGARLTERDVEMLERYNGNYQPPAYRAYSNGYAYDGYYDDGYGYYDDGPGVSVGIGIGRY